MISKHEHPIGFFDSGLGGTSIWREVNQLLPAESTIYLADNKNAPYGGKTKEEIIHLSKKNTEFLLNRNCKLIVVACNTATTNAINVLRAAYKVPFIGIEPAIKPAALQTQTKKIGILATKGTLNSQLFSKTSTLIDHHIELVEQVGEGLVSLIENGKLYSEEMTALLHRYIEPMMKKSIDCLVLGCTHYPYLIPQIQKIVGNKVVIIDSGAAVAKQTKTVLEREQLMSKGEHIPTHEFYANEVENSLRQILQEVPQKTIARIDF